MDKQLTPTGHKDKLESIESGGNIFLNVKLYIVMFSFKDINKNYVDSDSNRQSDDRSPFARLPEDEKVNHSFELQKVPRKPSDEIFDSESEGGESEINWAIPRESIQEMIDDSLQEAEKSFRVLIEKSFNDKLSLWNTALTTQCELVTQQARNDLDTTEQEFQDKLNQLEEKVYRTINDNLSKQKEYEQKLLGKFYS